MQTFSWHKLFQFHWCFWIWKLLKGREKVTKNINIFGYLKNEKSFLFEIKSIFHSFWGHLVKKQKENVSFRYIIGVTLLELFFLKRYENKYENLGNNKSFKLNFVLKTFQTKCLSAKSLSTQIEFPFCTLPQIYYFIFIWEKDPWLVISQWACY